MRTGTRFGTAVVVGLLATSAGTATADEGEPDPGYGSRGVATLATGNADRSSGEAIVMQGSQAVIAGEALDDSGGGAVLRAAITRATVDGIRDTTFGAGGQTLVAPTANGPSQFFAITDAPGNKMVAVGTADDGGTEKVLVVRFNADGSRDTTFDGDGIVLLARGNGGVAAGNAVHVEDDGSVVVAGQALDNGVTKLMRAKLNSAGGVVAWGGLTEIGADGLARANAMRRLPDGSFVLAGEAQDGATQPFIAKISGTTGALVAGFGSEGNGVGLLDVDTVGGARALAVKGGQLVITGAMADGATELFAAAFSTGNGAPDTSFGAGGRLKVAIGNGGESVGRAIQVDGAGKYLIAGDASQEIDGDPVFQFMTVRLTAAGALDTTYNPAGPQPGAALGIAPGGARAYGNGLVLREDGKAVLAGRVGSGPGERLATVRFCTADAQPCFSNAGAVDLPAQSPLAMSEQCGTPDIRGVAEIAVTGGYIGRVTVNVTSSNPSLFAVSPATQRVKANADGTLPASYTITHSGNKADNATIQVEIVPEGKPPVLRTYTVSNAVLAVSSISGATAQTPRDLKPGTQLSLTVPGIAVCSTPGYVGGRPIAVRMGNDRAIATGTRVDETVTFTTPRLATTGDVELVSVDGTGKVGAQALAGSVTVDTYRNSNGFAFKNFSAALSFDDMIEAFGADDVFVCIHVPFVGCVPSGVPDPWALTVWTLLQFGDGSCFGFSWVSEAMRKGTMSPATFKAGAKNAFEIGGKPEKGDAPAVRAQDITDEIESAWARQFSEEYMDFYRARTLSNFVSQTPSSLRQEIESMMRRDEHPLLSIRNGGSLAGLHVVTPYDIEDDPAEVGSYYIYVYDNNDPYDPADISPNGDFYSDILAGTTTNTSASRIDSRIHVRVDGSWSMPSSSFAGKQIANIIPGVWNLPPRDAEMLRPDSAISTAVTLFTAWAGEGIANLRQAGAAAPAGPPAAIDKVLVDGKEITTAPWTLATGTTTAPVDGRFIPAGKPYEVQLRGTRNGKQTQAVFGQNMVSKVTTSVTNGTVDTIDVAPKSSTVTVDPSGAAEPVTVEMSARTKQNTWRTAKLDTTTRGADGLKYDRAKDSYVIDHHGPATTVHLTLSSLEKSASPQEATAKLTVGRNQKVTFKPSSWKKLGGGKLVVRAGGKTRRVSLKRTSATTLKMGTPSIRKKGRTRTARVTVTIPSGTAAGTAKLTYVVRRGTKRVRSGNVAAGRPGRRTVSFKLPSAARKGDVLTVVGTAMRPRGGGFAVATSTKSTRVR